MAITKNNFLDHVRIFRAACMEAGAQALIAMESMQAFVRQGERQWVFHPQFQARRGAGQLQYQQVLTDDAWMFAGWLPYRLKRWDIALDKLAFKRYAASVGVAVPRHWLAAEAETVNVVVKSPKSSFGEQVHGPFRKASDRTLDLARGEYYESFIPGKLLKIWFWDAQPVCAEMDSMPSVWGDGASTIEELVVRRQSQHGVPEGEERQRLLARCEVFLRYQGRKLGDVPQKGERHTVEFRYGSGLMHPLERKILDFGRDQPDWLAQLREAGPKLYAAIPIEQRADTVSTVDAVLDPQGKVQMLEVNCNPTVHPLVYPVMLKRLLEPVRAPAVSSPQPA